MATLPYKPTVSTAWLAEQISGQDPALPGNALRIIDIRGHVAPATQPPPHYFNHESDYVLAHLPGALFVDWVQAITDPADPRHAQIAQPSRYAALMSKLGIGSETMVVAYDDAGGLFAARLWWSLQYYGHQKVAVLDGGWGRWLAEGRPTTALVPTVTPSQFVAQPNPAWYRDGRQVLVTVGADQTSSALVDMRSPAEFAGQASRAAAKGHIPGAVNQPRSDLITPEGTLLPADQLRAKFAALGLAPSDAESAGPQEVIFYCNAGVSASFGLLAWYAAGFGGDAAVYDGSWKDWGNDPSKPIA
jgi:thiosulfate/3-mercaptopyruvate sulfurtransferase